MALNEILIDISWKSTLKIIYDIYLFVYLFIYYELGYVLSIVKWYSEMCIFYLYSSMTFDKYIRLGSP